MCFALPSDMQVWNKWRFAASLSLMISPLAFGNGEGPFLSIALGNTWIYDDSIANGSPGFPDSYRHYLRTIRVTSVEEDSGRVNFWLTEKDSGRIVNITHTLVNGKNVAKTTTTPFVQNFVDSGWIDPISKTFQAPTHISVSQDLLDSTTISELNAAWMYYFQGGPPDNGLWTGYTAFFAKQDSLVCYENRWFDLPEGQAPVSAHEEKYYLNNVGLLRYANSGSSMAGYWQTSGILIRYNGIPIDTSLATRAKQTFPLPVRARARTTHPHLSPLRAVPVWTGEFRGTSMDALGRLCVPQHLAD